MRLTVGVLSCTNRFYCVSIGEVKEAWWIMLHPDNLSIQGTHARKYKRKVVFSFVLRSLNRTFDLSAQGTFTRKCKEKRVFLLHFARLIVPL